jgi:hypothetical protein
VEPTYRPKPDLKQLADPTFWLILIVNLLPLFYFFRWNWRAADILFLDWFETAFLLILGLLWHLFGDDEVNTQNTIWGIFLCGFMMTIYLMGVCGMDQARMTHEEINNPYLVLPRLIIQDRLWIQISILALLHGGLSLLDLIRGDRYHKDHLTQPLLRVVMLFFALWAGGILGILLHRMEIVYFVILALNIGVDLKAYRQFNQAKQTAQPVPEGTT